jgi:hypothetical protein
MTDYPLDMQLVVDPLNPENVVRNGDIYFYDPADLAGASPIALKDPSGLPLPNPLKSNDYGFVQPTIVTIPRVKWKSGDFEGFFYSYDGLRNEAVAAKTAALDAATQAAIAATAPTDAAVDVSVDKKLPPAISTALASNPTVVASAASMAQSTAGLVPVWKANEAVTGGTRRIAPNGDIVSAKINFTTAATYNAANWNNSSQDARTAALESKAGLANLITNGAFRDGFTGWGATTGWVAEANGITSWARAATGAAGLLTQSIVIPANLLGRTLRLKVLIDCTSSGTYRSLVTTVAGNTDLSHTLGTGPWVEKTLDIPIPASQGTTPINVQVGRSAGNVYMTSVRLEAL